MHHRFSPTSALAPPAFGCVLSVLALWVWMGASPARSAQILPSLSPLPNSTQGSAVSSVLSDTDSPSASLMTVPPQTTPLPVADTLTDIGALFDAAGEAQDQEAYDEALQLYDRIIEVDSTEPAAYYQRGRTLARQERYYAAAQTFTDYEAVDPTPRPSYVGTKGWYWLLAGEIDSARTASRRALGMNPNYPAWPLNLGHSFMVDYQPETAKFFYRQAMESIRSRRDLQRCLADFDTLATARYAKRISVDPDVHVAQVRSMKDWFHVTYLREGNDLRSQTNWLAFFGTWITLVGGLVSFFQESGKSLTPESRDAVRGWLLESDLSQRAQQWTETFRSLFESVFTASHWDWTCFLRSALASVGMIAMSLLIMIAFGWTTAYQVAILDTTDSVALGVFLTILFVGVINILVDYLSLYQTRRVIGWMTQTDQPWRHGLLLALDAGLTFVLPLVVMSGIQAIFVIVSGGLDAVNLSSVIEIPEFILSQLYTAPVLQAMYVSTFFTSIWLWLFVLGGWLIRAFNSALAQIQWLSALMDIESQPMKALGVILAVVVTMIFIVAGPLVL